jgi:hypothetical protein
MGFEIIGKIPMSFSLANIVIRICLTLSGASHADKSAVHNLSTSIDLTALKTTLGKIPTFLKIPELQVQYFLTFKTK